MSWVRLGWLQVCAAVVVKGVAFPVDRLMSWVRLGWLQVCAAVGVKGVGFFFCGPLDVVGAARVVTGVCGCGG